MTIPFDPNAIKAAVIAKIKAGEIVMKSKRYFLLRTIAVAAAAVLVTLALIYLTSFIFFFLHRSGAWFTPGFGSRGVRTFLASFPWGILIAVAILAIILEVLVERYAVAYRRPLVYSFLGVVVVALAVGYAASRTPFHTAFSSYARSHNAPLVGRFYRDIGERRPSGMEVGTVTEMLPGGFLMLTKRGDEIQVVISGETRLPAGYELEEGDIVVVGGERVGSSVQAFGVREVSDDFELPLPPRGRFRMRPAGMPPLLPSELPMMPVPVK